MQILGWEVRLQKYLPEKLSFVKDIVFNPIVHGMRWPLTKFVGFLKKYIIFLLQQTHTHNTDSDTELSLIPILVRRSIQILEMIYQYPNIIPMQLQSKYHLPLNMYTH